MKTKEEVNKGFEMAKDFIEFQFKNVEPKGDILPQFFAWNGNELSVGMIDPSFLSSPETKDRMMTMLSTNIVMKEWDAIAVVLCGWGVKVKTKEEYEEVQKARAAGVSMEELPNVQEFITINCIDQHESRGFHRTYARDPEGKPIWEGEWEDAQVSGDMVTPLAGAIGMNAKFWTGVIPEDVYRNLQKVAELVHARSGTAIDEVDGTEGEE